MDIWERLYLTAKEQYHPQVIQKLTQTASEVMHVPQEFFTVTIKELPDLNFGIGGRTIDKVKMEYVQAHEEV